MTTSRSLLRDLALLACALTAAWPLTELVTTSDATMSAAIIIVAVIGVGALCRRFSLPAAATLAVQTLSAVGAVACAMTIRGISPAPGHLRVLGSALNSTIQHDTTPLAATPAVVSMLFAAAALVALVVDFVGGTARMALFAAVPIVAPFVLTATAIGGALSPHYFVATALAWALLLFSQSQDTHHRWNWSVPTLVMFAAMSTAAIIAALLIAPAVPQRPAPALASGSNSGVDTSVDFSRSLDLRKSLHSTNSAPVLQYTSDAAEPAPLRVTTSSTYTDGVWQATATSGPFTSFQSKNGQNTVPIPGLAATTPTVEELTRVTINGLHTPLVAAPAPVSRANFGTGNDTFRIVTGTGIPVLTHPAAAYVTISRQFTAAARPTTNTAVTATAPGVTGADLDTSVVPAAARSRLEGLIASAKATGSNRFDDAVAIQRYLRLDGGFQYSLDAPTATSDGAALDPISAFLQTKQGYCTQFATAMIMAARLQGIPARMAIGFLPGTLVGKNRVIHASDAHAWPELYFPGMGWTRFDPTTPSRSGAAPAYAPDTTASSSASASTQSSASTSTSSAASTSTMSTPPPSVEKPKAVKPASSGWFTHVMEACAVVIALGLFVCVPPLAGRRERGRVLREARSARAQDEGHWHAMRWALVDLGLPLSAAGSPRQVLAQFHTDRPDAPSRLTDALERATASMESSRYAPAPDRSVESATERVVTAARDAASGPARVRAFLVPASGREFFRRLVRRRAD